MDAGESRGLTSPVGNGTGECVCVCVIGDGAHSVLTWQQNESFEAPPGSSLNLRSNWKWSQLVSWEGFWWAWWPRWAVRPPLASHSQLCDEKKKLVRGDSKMWRSRIIDGSDVFAGFWSCCVCVTRIQGQLGGSVGLGSYINELFKVNAVNMGPVSPFQKCAALTQIWNHRRKKRWRKNPPARTECHAMKVIPMYIHTHVLLTGVQTWSNL